MASKKDQGATEADVIFNRANVALARSQALIQSWLPPKTAEEIANTKSEQDLLREEEELFKTSPELLGVGAIAPESEQDAIVRRRGVSNQRLLEQLLGKKAAKGHIASSKAPDRLNKSNQKDASKQASARPAEEEQDSEEDEGRASLVASKTKRPAARNTKSVTKQVVKASPGAGRGDDGASSEEEDVRPTKKRGTSYLDDLLAQKAQKKKKKKSQNIGE